MAEVEMKTLTCPGPPEHTFEIPKGRGRPPRYCEEHKPQPGEKKGEEKVEGSRPAPGASRPKPGGNSEATRKAPPGTGSTRKAPPRVSPPSGEKDLKDQPAEGDGKATMDESGSMRRLPPPGKPDTQSRAKAEHAANSNSAQHPDTDQSWPRGVTGRPMAKVEFSASELLPTGQYANVAVGPARITAFIDLDHGGDPEDGIFTKRELQILAQASNELAETIEGNVVAVQRNIVLTSLQDQLAQNGKS